MSGSSSPAGPTRVLVDVEDRQQAHEFNSDHLVALLASTLTAQRPPRTGDDGAAEPGDAHEAEVGLAFISIEEMTELNIAHMGGTGPTDVLAFPIDGVAPHSAVPSGQPAMLGDIVICPAVAHQAPQALPDELALLVVHGALHLLGHDHAEPEETALMKELEQAMLEQFHRT